MSKTFPLDPSAPKQQDKSYRPIELLSLIVSIIGVIITGYFAWKTLSLTNEIANDKSQLVKLTTIVQELYRHDTLLTAEIQESQEQNRQTFQLLQLVKDELNLSNKSYQDKIDQDLAHFYNTIKSLMFFENNALRDYKSWDFDKRISVISHIVSVIHSESSNSFLLSNDTLSQRWNQVAENGIFVISMINGYKYKRVSPTMLKDTATYNKYFEDFFNYYLRVYFDAFDIIGKAQVADKLAYPRDPNMRKNKKK